jgi:hypothetical protein
MAWMEFLSNARMIENGGPRDMCANGSYTGDLLGDGRVSGTWEVRQTAGRATDVLLFMTQAGRSQPIQVMLSIEDGRPRFGGARMKVVETAACER